MPSSGGSAMRTPLLGMSHVDISSFKQVTFVLFFPSCLSSSDPTYIHFPLTDGG